MAKLRLKLKTTLVDGVAGKVDLTFNSTALENDLVLTTTDTTLEYDISLLPEINTVKVDLENGQADDYNPSTGEWGQLMNVSIDEVSYSRDGSTYISVIPQARTFFIPTGGQAAGTELTLRPQIDSVSAYGKGFLIGFNSDGLLPNTGVEHMAINPVATWDGTIYTSPDGHKFDANGNPVA